MLESARASGMATEVITSWRPLRYVGLRTLWKYLCFSRIFSRGRNGGSGSDDDVVVGASGGIRSRAADKLTTATHRRSLARVMIC